MLKINAWKPYPFHYKVFPFSSQLPATTSCISLADKALVTLKDVNITLNSEGVVLSNGNVLFVRFFCIDFNLLFQQQNMRHPYN